jgi:glycosyltransferase involved in cell wall biosynthesis
MPKYRAPEGMHVAYLSSYVPRECGIATFTEDLLKAVQRHVAVGESSVLATHEPDAERTYSREVKYILRDNRLEDYRQAAQWVNESSVDVVSVQHEFGIFGGEDGEYVVEFVRRVRKPIVTTLHTVLPEPSERQRSILRALARYSDRLIVMNALAVSLLKGRYGVDPAKTILVHHGAPDIPRHGRRQAKQALGLEGRTVISTFGLISPNKGLEYMLEALPPLVQRHPDVLYCILGRTHPGIVRRFGERYRQTLQRRVEDLGLGRHVRFVNEYFDKPKLIRWLQATDIYVTPYLNPDQIVSGTLAYAMVAGKAIVSTPYLYARFLLDEGRRGLLVPFRDSEALSRVLLQLLDHPGLRYSLEEATYRYGRRMTWTAVADRHVELFMELALAWRERLAAEAAPLMLAEEEEEVA